MKSYESIRIERDGHVAHLQLNRPERINALGKAMLLEIHDALDRLEADPEVRVIVLSGAGRGFSSGFDLKEQMARKPEGAAVWREILELDFSTTMRFWDSPKPTVAAIHGPCMAGADTLNAERALALGIVSRVVPEGTHLEAAMAIARHIAVIDPDLVRDTKKALNRGYEIQGLRAALATALDIDHAIESHGSPDKRRFMDLAREQGLKAALAWREARFKA